MNTPAIIATDQATGNLFRDLWQYRYALHNLVLKDFKVRYRNMSLGIAWSVINPLIMLSVLVVVFSYIHPNHNTRHFPIFLLIGMISFNFFSLCMTPAAGCIVENTALVKKIIFPRIILPISVVCSQMIQLLFQLAVLVFFIFLFRLEPNWHWLWVAPVFCIELIYILGMGMMIAVANVYFRDTQYLVHSILTVMFWFTPIFYDVAMVKQNLNPLLYWLYLLNPLAGCIDALRLAIIENRPPNPETLGVAVIIAVCTFIAGSLVFSSRARELTDKL